FAVSLDGPAGEAVTVDYATADGTATAGADYVPAAGTLTFAAGETAKTVEVTVLGDSVVGPNETFSLVLSSSAGAAVRLAIATGTITDSSRVPRIQFSAPAYVVSEAATRAVVSVRRTGPLTRTIPVGWTTYDGTAQTGSDYTGASGTLTFTP